MIGVDEGVAIKRFRIISDSCGFNFLTAQDQICVRVPVGTTVEVEANTVWVIEDGRRRETIDYPNLVELYVSRGEAVEESSHAQGDCSYNSESGPDREPRST